MGSLERHILFSYSVLQRVRTLRTLQAEGTGVTVT